MIDLNGLKSFLMVAEEGHLGRAAERLHLSQPALSRRLQKLERQLGFALFEQVGRGLRLTGQGLGFLVDCRDLLTHAGAVEERARSFASGKSGVLAVGATAHTIERMFPELLIRYRSEYPQVEVKLSEGSSRDSVIRLERGEIDLALIPTQGLAWLDGRMLPALKIFAVALSNRLRPAPGSLELNEIADEPILLLTPGYRSRQEFDAACRQARIEPRIIFESGTHQAILALAHAGLGIAIVPSTVSIYRQKLLLRELAQGGVPLSIPASICWHRHRYLPPYARQFTEMWAKIAERRLTTQIVA